MWVCPFCETANTDAATACIVCERPRAAPVEPVVPPAAQAPAPQATPRRSLAWVPVSVAFVGIVVLGLLYALTRGSSTGTDSGAETGSRSLTTRAQAGTETSASSVTARGTPLPATGATTGTTATRAGTTAPIGTTAPRSGTTARRSGTTAPPDEYPYLTAAMLRTRPDLEGATIEWVGGADVRTTRIRRDGQVIGYATFGYRADIATTTYDMMGFWPALAEFCAVNAEQLVDSDKVAFGCP